MKKKFTKEQIDAANALITATLYSSGINTNSFTEDEIRELEQLDDNSKIKRDRILEILNRQPLPNLDALFSDEEINLDAILGELKESE
jgi:hypothetical protein